MVRLNRLLRLPPHAEKYTVNAPKCTGSLTRTLFEGFTVAADFVIVKGGDEIEFASTTAGIVEEGVMKRE